MITLRNPVGGINAGNRMEYDNGRYEFVDDFERKLVRETVDCLRQFGGAYVMNDVQLTLVINECVALHYWVEITVADNKQFYIKRRKNK